MNQLTEHALNIAGNQVGVREATNKNDGPAVEKYLASVGLGKGYAWCMAFVYWCYKEAAKELGLKNPLFQTGGVAAQWNTPNGTRIKVPVPGCQFFIIHEDGTGHTGLVSGVFPNGVLHTIEGNTNNNGSREGIGVFRNMNRHVSQMKGFKIYDEIKS